MYELLDEELNQQTSYGADSRTKHLWLINPVSFVLSLCVYMITIKIILPKYMQNRKPFELKKTLIWYNALQVLLSVYLFYVGLESWFIYQKGSYWKCSGIVKDNSPFGTKPMYAMYAYFLSKYTEFFDTFFFILRKKFNQASFLHVYHHVSTPAFTWVAVRYYPGGSFVLFMVMNSLVHVVMYSYYLLAALGPHMQRYLWWKRYITSLQLVAVRYYPGGSFVLFMVMNSLVHVVMYSYYLLAALGPHMQRYLWWKRYITSLQLLQFYICMVHICFMLFSDCNIPKPIMLLFLANGFALHFLFSSFYKKTYTAKNKSTLNGTTAVPESQPSTSKANGVHRIKA